jgi:hypothetical protein
MHMHSAALGTGKELFLWPHQTKPVGKQNPNLRRRKHAATFQVAYHIAFQRLKVFTVLAGDGMNVSNYIAGDVLQRVSIVRRESAAART